MVPERPESQERNAVPPATGQVAQTTNCLSAAHLHLQILFTERLVVLRGIQSSYDPKHLGFDVTVAAAMLAENMDMNFSLSKSFSNQEHEQLKVACWDLQSDLS